MSNIKVNVIADIWEASINATISAAEKVPESHRMKQLQDGKSHPTWLLGHLAFAASFPVLTIALGQGPKVAGDWMQKFGPDFAGGQPIESDAGSYPTWQEILDGYKASGEAVVSAIRALDDSDLDGDAKGQVPEALVSHFTNLGKVLTGFVGHNAHHTGQIVLLGALD